MPASIRARFGPPPMSMEPWEIEFLATGNEPGRDHLAEFGMLYEIWDWRDRWEQVQPQILAGWLRMPERQRPFLWIRRLAAIGYISREVLTALTKTDATPGMRPSAGKPAVAVSF